MDALLEASGQFSTTLKANGTPLADSQHEQHEQQ